MKPLTAEEAVSYVHDKWYRVGVTAVHSVHPFEGHEVRVKYRAGAAICRQDAGAFSRAEINQTLHSLAQILTRDAIEISCDPDAVRHLKACPFEVGDEFQRAGEWVRVTEVDRARRRIVLQIMPAETTLLLQELKK